MSVNGVDQMMAQMRVMAAQASGAPKPVAEIEEAGGFSDMLKNSINKVNDLQQTSSAMATAFEMGESDASLAEVMIAKQKSSLAFQAMVQVRNKMVDAYKDIMNMPI
jgi:flagellar hook-basal body complex protein FliE